MMIHMIFRDHLQKPSLQLTVEGMQTLLMKERAKTITLKPVSIWMQAALGISSPMFSTGIEKVRRNTLTLPVHSRKQPILKQKRGVLRLDMFGTAKYLTETIR